MTTAFWQQDSDKVILTFLGPPGLTPSDVDVVATQNSLRAGLRSTGASVCDGSLFAPIKGNSAYYGIKSYANGVTAVVLVVEKARPGEQWPTLFADGAPENQRIFSVVCTVQAFSEYTGSDPSELTFPNEAVILVLYQDPSGWWNGFYDGNLGNLPSNFVSVLPDRPLTPDVDDPNNVTYVGRSGGAGMGMGMGMPMGMGRGMGFGAGVTGELGSALKRRTQMLNGQGGGSGGGGGGGGAAAPHRPPPPVAPQQAQQAELERQRQEQEAAAAAAAAEEERRRREEEERRRREEEEAEKQRKAAEADALAQELARKQMEAMQAQAAASTNPDIPVIDNLVPGVTTVKAISPYEGAEGELSFQEGDIIKVWQLDPSGWWEGECRGNRGWFPSNFVVAMPAQPAAPLDVLDQALEQNHGLGTLRHSSRAKGPSKRAPTMHAAPKIQTWDSTEQSPEAGAAAAAAAQEASSSAAAPAPAVHKPVGGVGMFPLPFPGRGGLPARGGRGGAGRAAPAGPPRGGMAARGGALPPVGGMSRGGGRGGGLPQPRGGGPSTRGGRPASARETSGSFDPSPQSIKPVVVARKPAPPRPEAPAASSAPVQSSPSSSASASSSVVTDPAKMNAPKNWGLAVPVSDFCAQAARLMKSVAAAGNASTSPNLPDVKNANARALAVCTFDGQVFVAGENAGPSAQGAMWPLLQAMLPQSVTRNLYSNQSGDDNKVATSAQNGCSISGAIAACATMMNQRANEHPWDRIARFSNSCSSICGGSVGFDLGAYTKTKKTLDVAWATGYAMKGAGSFQNNVADVMDLFFQLSSLQLSLPAAARMAAAIADSSSSGLPSKDEAMNHMRNFGLVNGVPVYGGESGLVIAAVPKIGGVAFWCPTVNSARVPVVSREFFKQLFEKFQV